MTPTLDYRDKIAILDLGDGENRFSPDWLETVARLLDEAQQHAQALVTTARGKFYSNGLDVDWLAAHPDHANSYIESIQALFGRILTFPLPTVAAVNGHAFGAGAMLATAHDYRVMRIDRGYFCFPEIDILRPFTPGMAALIQAKVTPQTAITAMSTGHRYGAEQAHAAGLIDRTAPQDHVLDIAVDLITPFAGKDPGTLAAIKSTMFAPVVSALAVGRT